MIVYGGTARVPLCKVSLLTVVIVDTASANSTESRYTTVHPAEEEKQSQRLLTFRREQAKSILTLSSNSTVSPPSRHMSIVLV